MSSTIEEQIAYQNTIKEQNNNKITELENQNISIDGLVTSTHDQLDSFEDQKANNLTTISNLQAGNDVIDDTIASLESLDV